MFKNAVCVGCRQDWHYKSTFVFTIINIIHNHLFLNSLYPLEKRDQSHNIDFSQHRALTRTMVTFRKAGTELKGVS